MPPVNPQRREDDRRLDQFEKKLDEVSEAVVDIRDMLISEPEASPLGRSLLARSRDNREQIADHDDRITLLEAWKSEVRGGWRLILGVATVLGIVATTFALLTWFGVRP